MAYAKAGDFVAMTTKQSSQLRSAIDDIAPHAGGNGSFERKWARPVENHQRCSRITTGGYFASITKQDCAAHAIENTSVRMTRNS
jgi:hypothetical protein